MIQNTVQPHPAPISRAASPVSSRGGIALRRLARLAGWWDLSKTELTALTGRTSLRLKRTDRELTNLVDHLDAVRTASRLAGHGPEWLRLSSNMLGGQTPLSVMTVRADGFDTVLDSLAG